MFDCKSAINNSTREFQFPYKRKKELKFTVINHIIIAKHKKAFLRKRTFTAIPRSIAEKFMKIYYPKNGKKETTNLKKDFVRVSR
jgi:hypothetical protein